MSSQCVENAQFLSRIMMGTGVNIFLCLSLLMKYLVRERTISFLWNKNIKERQAAINFWHHCKLDGVRLIVKMLKKHIKLFAPMRLDDEGIIWKPLIKFMYELCWSQCLGFKVFHGQVIHNWGEWRTHSDSACLFIKFTFKAKKGWSNSDLNQLVSIRIRNAIDHLYSLIDMDIINY